MSATIIIAKASHTGQIYHVDEINRSQGMAFNCLECGSELVLVKSERRKKDWHFRHKTESSCTGGRDSALHDLAVRLLESNSEVTISKKLNLIYSNPKREVSFMGIRSDLMVEAGQGEVHFEVVVTHDLSENNVTIYKSNKIKCIKIDLSDSRLLEASFNEIHNEVVSNYRNRTIIYWEDETVKAESGNLDLEDIVIIGGVLLAARWGWKKIARIWRTGKRRKRR